MPFRGVRSLKHWHYRQPGRSSSLVVHRPYIPILSSGKLHQKMPRLRRLSISSFFSFHGDESDSDDTPAPNTAPDPVPDTAPKPTPKVARISARIREHLKRLFPVKPPEVVPEPNLGVQLEVDPPTEEAIYLATLSSLPPLSPTGYQYAKEMGRGDITFAHFAGENYFRWLEDDLPGYEEVVGDEKAYYDRYLIEVHRRADYKELHDLFIPGNLWYPSENWEPSEINRASRSPFAICTTGVTVVKRQRSTTITPEKDSSSRVHKRATSSPDVSCKGEKTADPTDRSGDKSPTRPEPSGIVAQVLQADDFEEEEDVLRLTQKGHVKLLQNIPTRFEIEELRIEIYKRDKVI